eukprot:1147662-Pelagomonas_calceolata.AAC.3
MACLVSVILVKVRLHCYFRLQGQLSGNTEACNQTWPKNAQLTKLGLERRNNHNKRNKSKLASTRRALEKASLGSHRRNQARATASNPPDPH